MIEASINRVLNLAAQWVERPGNRERANDNQRECLCTPTGSGETGCVLLELRTAVRRHRFRSPIRVLPKLCDDTRDEETPRGK
jgi:hypothetical protein